MKPGFILIACRDLPLYKVPQFDDDRQHRRCQRCDLEPVFLCCCLSMNHGLSKALMMPSQKKVQAADFPLRWGAQNTGRGN